MGPTTPRTRENLNAFSFSLKPWAQPFLEVERVRERVPYFFSITKLGPAIFLKEVSLLFPEIKTKDYAQTNNKIFNKTFSRRTIIFVCVHVCIRSSQSFFCA
jgi:hypothetical protein